MFVQQNLLGDLRWVGRSTSLSINRLEALAFTGGVKWSVLFSLSHPYHGGQGTPRSKYHSKPSLRSDLHISPNLPHVVVTGDILLLLLLPGEGVGETAGEDDAQHLHHNEDAAHPSEDHEDDADLVIQPSLYDEQTTWRVLFCHLDTR